MKLFAVLMAAAAVSGCQTKTVEEMGYSERRALADQIVKRCIAQGVKPGTNEFKLCANAEAGAEVARRQRSARRQDAIAASGGGPTVCNTVGTTVICN